MSPQRPRRPDSVSSIHPSETRNGPLHHRPVAHLPCGPAPVLPMSFARCCCRPTNRRSTTPRTATRGPGWFDSSWDLQRGLEVREGLPGDPQLNEWIEACLRSGLRARRARRHAAPVPSPLTMPLPASARRPTVLAIGPWCDSSEPRCGSARDARAFARDRLAQLDHRHRVVARPVVARDRVEVGRAGHVARRAVAVLQLDQRELAVASRGRRR